MKSCLQRVRLWIHEILYGLTCGLNNIILSRSHSPFILMKKGLVYIIRKTQWNAGLSCVFSFFVIGENAEMATLFLSRMFHSSVALMGVASRISMSSMGHSDLCLVLGCTWQRCKSKQQPCNSLGVCFNTCNAKIVLRLIFHRASSYFFCPHRGICNHWSPPLSFPYLTHLQCCPC